MHAIRTAAALLLATSATPIAAQDMPETEAGKEALAILTEAIAVPTVQGRAMVPELAEKLTARLVAGGFAAQDVTFTPVGETGYLTARYAGRNSEAKPLVVIAHMDVVEAKPDDWERDPFTPVVEDGYIFGRGALDNKSGVALSMAALLEMKRRGWVPGRDVILGFSGDEETQMETTQAMAATLSNAALVLNVDGGGGYLAEDGAPMVYAMQAGEKTYADYRLSMKDPGGHSSRPGNVDIIAEMGAALDAIWKHKFTPQLSPLTQAYLSGSAEGAPPELAAAMRAFVADPTDAEAAATLSADPQWIGAIRTTCVPTIVSGGHAPNAMPQSVEANVNCRIFPGTPRATVQAELERIVANPRITFEFQDNGTLESIESPLDDDVMAAVTQAVQARAPGLGVVPNMSSGATDSMHFRSQGIPAFGVSPVFIRGDDEYAHGLNERLPLAMLDPGVTQLISVIEALAD
ncbi:M20/M25/M40 family metallo-hydrolase [Altererythrobacter sp. CAU 1778]